MVNMFVCSTKTNAIRTNTANNTNAELGEISPEVSGRSFVLLICLSMFRSAKSLMTHPADLITITPKVNMNNKKIAIIINTPLGAQSRYDEYEIGKAAIKHNIHVVTTISGAQAILRGIRMIKNKNLNYMSLQKIFKN